MAMYEDRPAHCKNSCGEAPFGCDRCEIATGLFPDPWFSELEDYECIPIEEV